jgi:DNA-binding Lrp family transcriptional regulator
MPKQNELLKELVAVRIKRVLARTGKQYERSFYVAVGRGVSPQEYTEILDKLVVDGVVKRTTGEREAKILELVA